MKRRRRTVVEKLRETINEMARLHKLRFESFQQRELEFANRLFAQADLHAREIVEFSVRLQTTRVALHSAISLVKASRQSEWTPACDQEFASVQEAARV